jgi:hypothetical protein
MCLVKEQDVMVISLKGVIRETLFAFLRIKRTETDGGHLLSRVGRVGQRE